MAREQWTFGGSIALVELWDLQPDFIGVIVPMKTGVQWTNQTGGCGCHHPAVEGLFIPMPSVYFPLEDPMGEEWITDQLTSGDEVDGPQLVERKLDLIDAFLICNPSLARMFDSPRGRYPVASMDVGEAWVPLVIRTTSECGELFRHFVGSLVILTYSNSD